MRIKQVTVYVNFFKRLILPLLIGVTIFSCAESPTSPLKLPDLMPRFDGLYYTLLDSNSTVVPADTLPLYEYFRFKENNLVSKALTWESPAEVARWIGAYFQMNYPFSRSPYFVTGPIIEFVTISDYGRIDYTGTIEDDKIVFTQHNHITGKTNSVTYDFVKVTFWYE
jgi:hypothetical protein